MNELSLEEKQSEDEDDDSSSKKRVIKEETKLIEKIEEEINQKPKLSSLLKPKPT